MRPLVQVGPLEDGPFEVDALEDSPLEVGPFESGLTQLQPLPWMRLTPHPNRPRPPPHNLHMLRIRHNPHLTQSASKPLPPQLRRRKEHQLHHTRHDRSRHHRHQHPELPLRVRLEHLKLLPLIP